jgi:hypothetical protein
MSNAVTHPVTQPGVDANPKPELPKPEEIRNHLQEVLKSSAFQGSKRCRQFLAYVCEKSLGSATVSLKERTIAVEVFGRSPQSDLADDTIVRVGAREVRKRLQQYYLTPAGASTLIRIDLPTGSYAPDFHYANVSPKEKPPAETALLELPPVTRSRPNRVRLLLIATAVVMAVTGAAMLTAKWARGSPEEQAFTLFWEPVFRSPEPLLLAMAHPIVYHPSARAVQWSEQGLAPQEVSVPRPIQVPPDKLNGSDLLPVLNQYVGYGDMVAANEVTAMLAQRSKKVRLRLASGIEFPDLRKTNTLLIGAISNSWTMRLQQSWRFQFRWTPAVRTVVIDTMSQTAGAPSGEQRQWFVESKEDEAYQEDYVMVSRIRNSITGGLLLVGAGLKGVGTEAAGRLLVDAEQLGTILRKLPSGWDAKNLQILLHVKVIGNAPAQPEMVAWHVW